MTASLLIRNPLFCARMNDNVNSGDILKSFSGGHIYIEGNRIVSAGPESFPGTADQVIDAHGMVVFPGFINTHHHFYQTLTRSILATQDSVLFDWLTTHYDIWRGLSAEAFYVSAKVAIAELSKSGCTTTSDQLYLFPRQSELTLIDREIEAAREMGIRFQPTRGSMSMGKESGGLPPNEVVQSESQIIADTYRLLKQYHSDSPGAMTRISLAPCSPFSVSSELMHKTLTIAQGGNLQIHTHLAETKDEEKYCLEKFGKRPFEFMRSLGWISPLAWFAHCVHLNEHEIQQAGANQIGVSHCPTSNMRLGSGIAPIKELLSAGANVSLGVDGSASNDSSNLLLEMRNALLLSRLRPRNYWLSSAEVLWMATMGGAKALGRDDIGQITPGKCADLTLISLDKLEYSGAQHDPAAAILFCVAMQPVDWLIVNGNIIVKKGRIITPKAEATRVPEYLDEKALIKKHQHIADQLVSRAETLTGKSLTRKN